MCYFLMTYYNSSTLLANNCFLKRFKSENHIIISVYLCCSVVRQNTILTGLLVGCRGDMSNHGLDLFLSRYSDLFIFCNDIIIVNICSITILYDGQSLIDASSVHSISSGRLFRAHPCMSCTRYLHACKYDTHCSPSVHCMCVVLCVSVCVRVENV